MLFNFYALGLSWGQALTPTGQLHWGHTPPDGAGGPFKASASLFRNALYKQSIKCHLFALLKDYVKERNEDLEDSPNVEVKVNTANPGLYNVPAHWRYFTSY